MGAKVRIETEIGIVYYGNLILMDEKMNLFHFPTSIK